MKKLPTTFALVCFLLVGCNDLGLRDILSDTVAKAKGNVMSAPTFAPEGGTYQSEQLVTISSTTPGASIRYTTDGTIPTKATGTLYTAPVSVGVSESLKAVAFEENWLDSEVAMASYTLAVTAPTFSPNAGTFVEAQAVTISSTTSGASIHYTTDGTTPSETAGTLYTAPISAGVSETIRAIAFKSGWTSSTVSSAVYWIDQCAPPTFSPSAGTYASAQSVTISALPPGASIRYTLDGSTPSKTAGTLYSPGTPVSVGVSETLKAIAYNTGWQDSEVASSAYTLAVTAPTFTPPAGTYSSAQAVAITTTTPGAIIHYTTDGSDPTETTGLTYTTAVPVGANETLKAIAFETGWTDSPVATAGYTLVVAAPTFSPAAGPYPDVQVVTISTATLGASIRYTTDGSTPTVTTGTPYTTAVSVPANETLKAIAFESGWTDSPVSTAVYSIVTGAPTFSPSAGSYSTAQTVTLTPTTAGSLIRYTTDSSTPSETAGTLYTAPFSVGVNQTVRAIAYKTGWTDSSVASAGYTLVSTAPTFTPSAGTYNVAQNVALSSTTSGASIRYTTDGSTPSETAGTLYTVPFYVSVSETVKAISYLTGWADSSVASASYTIIRTFVYVANAGDNTVSGYIMNAGTGALISIGAVAAGAQPHSVAVDPLGRFVYVANENDNTVSEYKINSATGALISIGTLYPAGGLPTSVVVDPTGRFAYVANGFGINTVSACTINSTTGALTLIGSSIGAGNNPYSLAVDPTGKFVYAADFSSDNVSAYSINSTTGALTSINTPAAGSNPISVTVDPNGKFAYVVNFHSNSVWAYSINSITGALTYTGTPYGTGSYPGSFATDPLDKYAYVANSSDNTVSVYTVNSTTGAISVVGTAVTAGSAPGAVTVDPSGKFVYIANYNDKTIWGYSINSTTGALTYLGTSVLTGVQPISVAIIKLTGP